MAYSYTGIKQQPDFKIAQAKSRISNDNNSALATYLAIAQEEEHQGDGVIKPKDASVGKSIAETAGDVGLNVLTGLGKFFEGIIDFGASTWGVISQKDKEDMDT